MSTLTLRNVKGTPLTNTEVDDNFSNLNTDKLEKDGSNSMTGKLTTVTSSASTASIRVVAGSADPTSPVSGDVWNNAGDFKFYTGSATRVLTTLDGAQTLTNKTLDAAIVTNGLYFEGATADAFETLLTVVDPTADRTITIPDATTTMVGTDVSQTLTNKTINLTSNTLVATSAQMLAAVTDETGTGSLVFANTPTLVTPIIAEVDATADFTLDAGADIILDADGGDIILRDGGTEFGRLVNNSGQLRLASSSSNTAAINLTGAEVALVGDLTIGGNDIKSSGGTTAITLNTADVTVAGDLQVTGNDIKSSTGAVAISLSGVDVAIAGNLTVNGTTTTVNSTTLDVDDVNITLAKGNSTNLGADGAGITIEATTATNKTFTYNNSNDSWTSSEHMNVASGKQYRIGGSQIAASNLSNGTTGTGAIVLETSPTLVTPTIGIATATSVNKVAITAPATSATLTLANGSTLATAGAFSTTLTATAATNVTLPTTGTLATLAGSETFTNKTLTTPDINAGTVDSLTSLSVRDTSAAYDVTIGATSSTALTAARTLTLDMKNGSRTLSMEGNVTHAGAFAQTFTATGATSVTLPTSGTLATRAGTETLTNKTVDLANNTLTGTLAQFNTALSDADFATLAGSETLTNKTLTSPTLTTPTAAIINGATTASGTLTLRSTSNATKATAGVLMDENIASSSKTTGTLVVTGGLGVGGAINAGDEITAYAASDARLKENVMTITDAMSKVQAIRGVTFDWKDEVMATRGEEDGYFVRKHEVGVIAQEIESVLPEVVATRDNGFLAVRYEKMVPLLIEAIKELKADLDEVKKNCNCTK